MLRFIAKITAVIVLGAIMSALVWAAYTTVFGNDAADVALDVIVTSAANTATIGGLLLGAVATAFGLVKVID